MSNPISTIFPVSLKEGDRVIVTGTFRNPQVNGDFGLGSSFNFINQDGSVNLFHFNTRINNGVQVNNTYNNGSWGAEERVPNIFKVSEEVKIEFEITAANYQVSVNGKNFLNYNHRLPFANVKNFKVAGCFDVKSIRYIEPVGLYRSHNPKSDDHFYSNLTEIQSSVSKDGYQLEGLLVKGYASAVNGAVPLYRMFNTKNGHFYTTNAVERDRAVSVNGYNDEGIAIYVFPSPHAGAVPVFRFLKPNGFHFYTQNANEAQEVQTKLQLKPEGIAFYGFP